MFSKIAALWRLKKSIERPQLYSQSEAPKLSYTTKYEFATCFSRYLGCWPREIAWTNQSILAMSKSEAIERALQTVGVRGFEGGAYQCQKWSAYFRPYLEQELECPVHLTIGQIWRQSTAVYHPTWLQLERWYRDGFGIEDFATDGRGLNFHVWLTLESSEILDLTYLSSLAAINPKDWGKYAGHVLGGYPNDVFLNHTYHPMVVGDEYAIKLNATSPVPILAEAAHDLYSIPMFATQR